MKAVLCFLLLVVACFAQDKGPCSSDVHDCTGNSECYPNMLCCDKKCIWTGAYDIARDGACGTDACHYCVEGLCCISEKCTDCPTAPAGKVVQFGCACSTADKIYCEVGKCEGGTCKLKSQVDFIYSGGVPLGSYCTDDVNCTCATGCTFEGKDLVCDTDANQCTLDLTDDCSTASLYDPCEKTGWTINNIAHCRGATPYECMFSNHSSCDVVAYTCGAWEYCDMNDGVCKAYFSQAKDGDCSTDAMCQWPMYCTGGKCTELPLHKKCSAGCPATALATCWCNGSSYKSGNVECINHAGCQTEYAAMETCAITNKCGFVGSLGSFAQWGLCLLDKCASEAAAMQCCNYCNWVPKGYPEIVSQTIPGVKCLGGAAYAKPTCCDDACLTTQIDNRVCKKGGASAITYSLALILVSLFALL